MSQKKTEQKFRELVKALPANGRYDLTPVVQKVSELEYSCQMKVEILGTNKEGATYTDKKATALSTGDSLENAQYNALKLALIQLQLI